MKKKNLNIHTPPASDVSLSSEHWEEFERGITYFNNGQFQHSFEAWELIWEQCEKSQRQFIRGLMDTALGCLQIVQKNGYKIAMSNFEKAREKLGQEQFQPEFLGVPVKPLLNFIEQFQLNHKNNGTIKPDDYYRKILPRLQFHKPANPDLLVELYEILRAEPFVEGVKLFNKSYYWEAHEAWEEIWREQVGEGKNFIEAFARLAEAYNFTKLGKFNPAIYLFEKSIKKLQEFERIDCALMLSMVVTDAEQMLTQIRMAALKGDAQFKFVKPSAIKLTEQK